MKTSPSHNSERELRPIPMVNGLDCPACGHPVLILGDGGYVTCSLEGCPNPDYAEALEQYILSQKRQVIEEIEKAGPENKPLPLPEGLDYMTHSWKGYNKANQAWRTLLKQLRLKYGESEK